MTEKEREMAATTTYGVAGMTCGHCVSAVQTEVGRLAGVREVTVELVVDGTSTVRVSSDGALDDTSVAEAVDEAGYELVRAAS